MIIDSHCHLNMLSLEQYDGDMACLVAETTAAGAIFRKPGFNRRMKKVLKSG